MKNYKVIVTGGTGFIGKRVAKLLPKCFKKKNVLCLVWDKDTKLEREGREVINSVGIDMKKIDLVTGKGLEDLPKSPEVVIHMAANTNTSDPDHRANDVGTKNLIKSFENISSNTHVVYTSTTVFHSGRKDCKKPLSGKSKGSPTNEYGRTKLNAERWLKKDSAKKNYRLTILRLNTVYGPGPRPDSMFEVVPQMVENNSILARFNWPGITGIVYVDDTAELILKFANRNPKPGKPETYVLCAENLNLAQISREIYKALNKKYQPINLPEPIWSFGRFARQLTPYFEKVLPISFYNYLWRTSLLVDDVIYCETDEIQKVFGKWKLKKLHEVSKVIIQ